jgi:D-sedoheptulose 7-phosphate isomerase
MEKGVFDYSSEIKKQIEDSISVKKLLLEKNVDIINKISELIVKAYENNNKILWMGNGGSAADSQHLACELVSKFRLVRKAIPSISLTTNTSILTAISNDFNYVNIFERQVEALAENGDILIGISTSGKSKNIIEAFKTGKKIGTVNVGFTGEYIDDFENHVDYIIPISSNDTPRIQESHIMIGHILCDIVEEHLFGENKT